MSDNTECRENQEQLTFHDKNDSHILLQDMVMEYEEELYTLKVQLKNQNGLMAEKQNELSEKERIKADNLGLFSPIYNKVNETTELTTAIDQIKETIKELKDKEEKLSNRILRLKIAAEYIEESIELKSDLEKIQDKRQKFGDKGLSILEAQEIERQRIARDLHDTTVQNLTSMVHKSELCIKLIDIDTIRAKLELSAMSNTVKTIINDMRGIIYNLKPMSLDDLGLTITIERLSNKISELHNIKVELRSNTETKEILPVIKLTLFRIIQEACNNVIKHANATMITIDIFYEEHQITVKIEDNGEGFNQDTQQKETLSQSSSFGLSIMRERISLLSGTVDIMSEIGKGTKVTVTAPLTIYEGEKNE